MQEGGADIIELGIPFSDPIADGISIQESNTVCSSSRRKCALQSNNFPEIALENGIDYTTCLSQVREARAKGLTAPVLLMGTGFYCR
jgi:tryptophan synthase